MSLGRFPGMKPSQKPGSRMASRATVATAPAARPTTLALASDSSKRYSVPTVIRRSAVAGRRANFASTSIALLPDSAIGKISGDTAASASNHRIVNARFIGWLLKGGIRVPPFRSAWVLLLGDHVGQHVQLLIEHACRLVNARVVELLEHHRWFVVAQVSLAVRALVDVHAHGQVKAGGGVFFKHLLADIRIADEKEGSLHVEAGHLHHVALVHGAHHHHAAFADGHLEGLDCLVEGFATGDTHTGLLCEGGGSGECCKQGSKQCDAA